MTLAASVEVMEARRDDMPERAQAALDLLSATSTGSSSSSRTCSRSPASTPARSGCTWRRCTSPSSSIRPSAVSSVPATPVARLRPGRATWSIRGDKRRLARVIANLLDNARAYGGGEPEISIAVVEDRRTRSPICRSPSRTAAPACPPDDRDLVFDRFARGGGAGRRTGSDGVGLGLALVDEHVRLHGGRVWVEDRPDGESGARFVVELHGGWSSTSETVPRAAARDAIGLALLLVAVIGVAGCAIQPDGAPRAIPDKDQLVVVDRPRRPAARRCRHRAWSTCSRRMNRASRNDCAR